MTERLAVATYVFFEPFPLTGMLAVVGTLLTMVFFVTSSDSASLVIDYLSSGGDQNPPKRQRVFWAFAEGGVAVALLLGGGLTAMRSFQLCTGVPLTLVLFAMCAGLVLALMLYKPQFGLVYAALFLVARRWRILAWWAGGAAAAARSSSAAIMICW